MDDLQQQRLKISPKGPQVPVGPCCNAWSNGKCSSLQSTAAASEAWHCAALRKNAALRACRAKVAAASEARTIALAYVGDEESRAADVLKTGLREGIDFALSAHPATGFAKDCYEAATGKRALTGEALTPGERMMALLGVATAGTARTVGAVLRRMEALRVAGKVRKFARASDTLQSLAREVDTTITLTRRESAAALNSRLPSPGYGSDGFVGTTKSELRFYRLHETAEPMRAGATSVFVMPVIPGPATTAAIRDAYALPAKPNFVSEIVAPRGTEVRISLVAPNDKLGAGGKIQYELLNPRVDWFKATEVWLPAGQTQMP